MTTAIDAPNRDQVTKTCFGGFDENGKRIKLEARKSSLKHLARVLGALG